MRCFGNRVAALHRTISVVMVLHIATQQALLSALLGSANFNYVERLPLIFLAEATVSIVMLYRTQSAHGCHVGRQLYSLG